MYVRFRMLSEHECQNSIRVNMKDVVISLGPREGSNK